MIFKPELNNQEQVLAWYESRDNACFIIFTGVKCDSKAMFSKWINEDGIEGKDRLLQSLKFITDNVGNSNTYTILSFPYEEGCESWKVKDIEGETIRFQFHVSGYSVSTIGNAPQIIESKDNAFATQLFTMMQKQNELIMTRFEQIELKIQEQEGDEDDDDDDDDAPIVPTGKERLMGALAGIVENPAFAETVLTIGATLIGKLFDNKKTNNDGGI